MTGQDRLPELPPGRNSARELLMRTLSYARRIIRGGAPDSPLQPDIILPGLTPNQRNIADVISKQVAAAVSFPEEQRRLALAKEEERGLLEYARSISPEELRHKKKRERKYQEVLEARKTEFQRMEALRVDVLQRFHIKDKLEAMRALWGRGTVAEVGSLDQEDFILQGYALQDSLRKVVEVDSGEWHFENSWHRNSGDYTISWCEKVVSASVSLRVTDKLDAIRVGSSSMPWVGSTEQTGSSSFLEHRLQRSFNQTDYDFFRAKFPALYRYWYDDKSIYWGRQTSTYGNDSAAEKMLTVQVDDSNADEVITQLLAFDWYLRSDNDATPEQMYRQYEAVYQRSKKRIGKKKVFRVPQRSGCNACMGRNTFADDPNYG